MKLYLEQLIYALNESDIERLKNMDLRKSKMKYYLGILMESRKQGIPTNDAFMKELDLDSNSFAKLRSVTLSRCLKELVPEGGANLLRFLSQHRLQEIFMREVDEQIKKMEQDSTVNEDAKAEIYLKRIKGYIRLPYGFFDANKLDHFIEKFLNNYSQPNKPILKEALKLNKIFILIVKSHYAMDTTSKNYDFFSGEIKNIRDKITPLNIPRLNYFSDGIKLILDFYYKSNYPELQEGFERLVHSYSKLNDPDTHDELLALRFYSAYNHIMKNNFSKANEMFGQIENDYKDVFQFYPKIVFRYALSLLIEGRNEDCNELMHNYMRKDIIISDPDSTIMSCIIHTAYHLLENEMDAAAKYIDLYNSMPNIKSFMSFKLGMKLFEAIYHFQKGEDKFAALQLEKTVRYLKDKKATQASQNNSKLNKALLNLLNKFIEGKTDLQGFENEIGSIFKGNQVIVNKLFINAINVRKVRSIS